jgi:lipopolysaccharide heptosyltransferase II
MDAPPMENPARVLIIDTAWLGDVIFTTALIGAVKSRWPECEVHVLVAPRGEPLLRAHPNVARLWIFDKRGHDRGFTGLRRFTQQLMPLSFGLILNAHPSFRSRLLTRFIGAPVRVGYRGFGARFCFTHTVPNDLAVEPDHVRRRLALLKAAFPSYLIPHTSYLSVPALPEELAWSQTFLTQHALTGTRILALIPGSAWETKRWPLSHFRSLAQRWIAERQGSVLVFGGSSERAMITELCRGSGGHILPVFSAPLPRVAALLKLCEAAVGNDTGVTFLAVAVGGPRVLALYGCTQVDYTFPPPHQAITAEVPCCLPRTGHGAHHCKWGDVPWCMSQIAVERVWGMLAEKQEAESREQKGET